MTPGLLEEHDKRARKTSERFYRLCKKAINVRIVPRGVQGLDCERVSIIVKRKFAIPDDRTWLYEKDENGIPDYRKEVFMSLTCETSAIHPDVMLKIRELCKK